MLIFSHRVDTTSNASQYFANAAEALSADGDATAATHKFSLLGQLESFRRGDGLLELKLVYPELAPPNYNHWVQQSNPTNSTSVLGYQALNVNYPYGFGGLGDWRGLALSPTTSAFLDGLGTSK